MILIGLLVSHSTLWAVETDLAPVPQGSAATVGKTHISTADLTSRIAVEKAYGNADITVEAAIVALIGDALQLEVGRAEKVIVTPEETSALAKHVTGTSRAPEILAKVKAVFGGDTRTYERLYLNPRILNDKLRGYYSRSTEIHAARRAQIENAFKRVASGGTFKQAAEQSGVEVVTFECGHSAAQPAEVANVIAAAEPSALDPLLTILEHMSVGEINKDIVEDDASFKLIHLVAKNGNKYTVEALQVNKPPFEEWFKQRAATIAITIQDRVLKTGVEQKYSQLWWVRQINLPETK